MKLYFVRHGKAAQSAPTDEQRPLTEDGIESMKHMAVALKKAGCQPTIIYTSPRVRAFQTAALIAEQFGMKAEVNNACNFEFDAKAAVKLCEGFDEDAEVMFVGHNPSMSEVIEHVTGAAVDLSTGGVACVTEFFPPSTRNAVLKWLLIPRVIDPLFTDD